MNTLERPRRVVVLPKWSAHAAARAENSEPAANADDAAPTTPSTPATPSTAAPEGPSSRSTHLAAAPQPTRSYTAPLLLLSLALLVSLGDQCWQRLADREQLRAAHAQQQATVDKATRLRASLDALAADTQRLADGGNAPAQLLVEELRRRGITINAAAITPAR